jgi:hypothetical protein
VERATEWAARLRGRDPETLTLIAERDGEIVG